MLIAMAGLPGTGKSTLAAALAAEFGAVVLGKDEVRAVLFPPRVLDYSREQNDVSMAAVYSAAACILHKSPRQTVILDGRTFLRAYQVADLLALAASTKATLRLIECVCDDDVARARVDRDRARGSHPAGNRSYALYLEVKAAAEPIAIPHLTLDTGRRTLAECVADFLEFLS